MTEQQTACPICGKAMEIIEEQRRPRKKLVGLIARSLYCKRCDKAIWNHTRMIKGEKV